MPKVPSKRRTYSDLNVKGVPPDLMNNLIKLAERDRSTLTAEVIRALQEYVVRRREDRAVSE